MIGGLGGAFLAKSLIAPNLLGDPSFTLNGGNLLVEMFFSFSLVLTILQTTVSKVQSRRGVAAPAIATLVGLGAALGASMNPAVAWGLCSATGQDKGSLALWLFPAIAAIPAALAFRFSDAEESEAASPHVSFLPKIASAKTVRAIGALSHSVPMHAGTLLSLSLSHARHLPIPTYPQRPTSANT